MTILLQTRRPTDDDATQLTLFPDEVPAPTDPLTEDVVDGLAPARGVLVSVTVALLVWATLLTLLWNLVR